MVLEQLDIYTKQKGMSICALHQFFKNDSKWNIDLDVKPKTIKLLEENTEENLCDLGLGKVLLDMTPKA